MKNKLIIILQARTGSTRLPQKMIKPFYQKETIPEIIINNLKTTFNSNQIILATTVNSKDDDLEVLARSLKINYFRGDENDVLKRFIDCADKENADLIVRICADNPFLRPEYINPLINNLLDKKLEYCSFQWKDGTPIMLSHIGVFAEVMTIGFLKKIEESTTDPLYREHVTNYIYNHKNQFKQEFLNLPDFLNGREHIRLTVDTKEDFILAQELYEKIQQKSKDYNLPDLLELIDENPVFLNRMKDQIKENAK